MRARPSHGEDDADRGIASPADRRRADRRRRPDLRLRVRLRGLRLRPLRHRGAVVSLPRRQPGSSADPLVDRLPPFARPRSRRARRGRHDRHPGLGGRPPATASRDRRRPARRLRSRRAAHVDLHRLVRAGRERPARRPPRDHPLALGGPAPGALPEGPGRSRRPVHRRRRDPDLGGDRGGDRPRAARRPPRLRSRGREPSRPADRHASSPRRRPGPVHRGAGQPRRTPSAGSSSTSTRR
jgi:hypothetical protein